MLDLAELWVKTQPFFVGLTFIMVTQEKFIMVTQETIIDWWWEITFWCFSFLERNPIFDGKMGVSATVEPKGQGPHDPTKKLVQRVDLLGQPFNLENMFTKFSGPVKIYNNTTEYARDAR